MEQFSETQHAEQQDGSHGSSHRGPQEYLPASPKQSTRGSVIGHDWAGEKKQ
jgi:hypothetical protein